MTLSFQHSVLKWTQFNVCICHTNNFWVECWFYAIVRPYKIIWFSSTLFQKNRGGRRHFILIFFTQDTRKSSIWSVCSRYLVKGRYRARAIAIKFIERACKNWDGDECRVIKVTCYSAHIDQNLEVAATKRPVICHRSWNEVVSCFAVSNRSRCGECPNTAALQ